ncbi:MULTISPECIES: hypothetical protein [unclassified Microbacterium]|uniref:hypothetical protein n=1 Tax=unclassified Microbacterium TaxID=2609290 RepID=UPI0016019BB5|nr:MULTISPECIES: hypothetical protein [unclassified Microbacterium]MBT2483819.1 hypothetical protein [Microbacterium sp. ISL-108]
MTMTIADELLRGPRGRRLCLAYATRMDEQLRVAVFWLGHELDPHPGTIIRFRGEDDAEEVEEVQDPAFTEAEVAEFIRGLDLTSISADAAREAMCETVDHARYWQEPDGDDAVAALPAVRDALSSIAARLVTVLPDLTAPSAPAQWAVDWRVASDSAPIERSPAALLAAWTVEQREDEERAAWERPRDPHANFSGTWWSVPYQLLATRTNVMDALQLVEDSLGWEVATVIPVRGTGRILELRTADDWAGLCREYPMEVTASRRHDWFRVTGRDGTWLIPDWERVAQQWDAVHLTTLAYLSAATRLIEVDTERATVIAGWGPDATVWLTDVAREWHEPRQQWRRVEGENLWAPEEVATSGRSERPMPTAPA